MGEGARLSFAIGWLFLFFFFSSVGELWIKKRLMLFLEGIGVLSCGYLWLSFYLRSHCSFTYDYVLSPPPPPLSLPIVDAEIWGQSEHTLQKDCYKNNFLFKWCDLGLFLQFKFSQSRTEEAGPSRAVLHRGADVVLVIFYGVSSYSTGVKGSLVGL